MKYKDFVEKKEVRQITTKESMNAKNGKDVGKKILNIINTLAKVGLTVAKVIFKITKNVLKISFRIVNDGVSFIAHKLQISFYKLDENKQDKFIKGIVTTAILTVIGGGIVFNNLSNKITSLESGAENVEVAMASNDLARDSRNIEVEIVNETKEEKTNSTDNKVNAKTITSSEVDFFGDISFKSTIGELDPGYIGTTKIRYEESGKKIIKEVDTYGIGEFTTVKGKRYVKDFTDYVKEVDSDFYNEYFDGVGKPGTTTFTTGWYNASKTESDKFTDLQFDYLYSTYIEPTVKALDEEYDLDFMSSKALQEFIFSTANQYGKKGTLTLFEKANVTSDMDIKEIIESVQKEKIESLGVYTYTDKWDYSDKDREDYKTRAENELKEFLDLL